MESMQIMAAQDISEIAANNRTMEISHPTRCNPGATLELTELIFKDNGALLIPGDCTLKIEKVYNYKNEESQCNYEFIFAGEDGKNASAGEKGGDGKNAGTADITFGKVYHKIRVDAHAGKGGKGYDGADGKDGGTGGDGYQGGDGGSGGDATAGTDGGNGGGAPNITITYTTLEPCSAIYVNGKKADKQREYNLNLHGGAYGEGGKGAKGGKGGYGGNGVNFSLDGKPGKVGIDSEKGNDGVPGADGQVTVKCVPLEEILDNLNGLYVFDFSIDEDREYFLKDIGGEKALENKPLLLEAYAKTCGLASARAKNGEVEKQSISIKSNGITFSTIGQNSLKDSAASPERQIMTRTLTFNLFDNTTPINDPKSALTWQSLVATGKTVNLDDPTRQSVIDINLEYVNSNGGTKEFSSEATLASYFHGNFATQIRLRGVNANGELFYGEFKDNMKINENSVNYSVTDITVNEPKWNGKHDNHIVMLYGRMDTALPEYKDPDYMGGDYLNNIKSDGKLCTLMPVTGTVTFNDNFDLVGLTEPDAFFGFTRSAINYDNKAAGLVSPDIVYQNNLTDDQELYKLMKAQCFKEMPGVAHPRVEFDLRLDRNDETSKLDWHDYITGANDNNRRTVLLQAAFSYRIHRKTLPEKDVDDVQICITSISKEDLDEINKGKAQENKREYYKFFAGSNTVYIPPVNIYWGCFGKDVGIKTENGSEKTASEIKIGDRLLAYGGKIVTVGHIIAGYEEEIYSLKFGGGYETMLSGTHPVLCEPGKGVPVNGLNVGDKVMMGDGGSAELVSVEKVPYEDTVYNFIFEGESESVYVNADGIYAGDFNAQNENCEKPELAEEEKERSFRLLEELRRLRVC